MPAGEQGDENEGSDANARPEYRDVHTGVGIDASVQLTPRGERSLGFAASLDAWDPRPRAEAQEDKGRAPCGTRWLDQKGDAATPEHCGRFVVQETQQTSTIPQKEVAGLLRQFGSFVALRRQCQVGFCSSWTYRGPTHLSPIWYFVCGDDHIGFGDEPVSKMFRRQEVITSERCDS